MPCSPGHGTGKRSDLAKPSGGSKCGAAPKTFKDETQPVQRAWKAGYTADPPCGVQMEEREGEGRAGTASLLALAHNLSTSPQPDSRETLLLTDDIVSLLFPQQIRWRWSFSDSSSFLDSTPKIQGQETHQSLLKTEIIYFLISNESYESVFYLLHNNVLWRIVFLIVLLSYTIKNAKYFRVLLCILII